MRDNPAYAPPTAVIAEAPHMAAILRPLAMRLISRFSTADWSYAPLPVLIITTVSDGWSSYFTAPQKATAEEGSAAMPWVLSQEYSFAISLSLTLIRETVPSLMKPRTRSLNLEYPLTSLSAMLLPGFPRNSFSE